MSYPRFLASLAALTVGSYLLSACGGEFKGGDGGDSGSGGQSGGTGKGGSGATGGGQGKGGSGGSAGGGGDSCLHDGAVYADGESFPAGDGCNTCSCSDGEVLCTLQACPEEGCVVGDLFYPVGSQWDADCNTCYCDAPGEVSCTLVECVECTDIGATYEAAMDGARTCDPELTGQCSQVVFGGLQCGCETFVNPENVDAIAAAQLAQQDYQDFMCGGGVVCGLCLPPSSSYCSSEGRCVDVYESGVGASCKVEGIEYPSGSSNVPDPYSCNTCDCVDGYLQNCTELDCPQEVCPPDTVASTQCTQCGANDGCEVVEHACLLTCLETCLEGTCVLGVCKSLCG